MNERRRKERKEGGWYGCVCACFTACGYCVCVLVCVLECVCGWGGMNLWRMEDEVRKKNDLNSLKYSMYGQPTAGHYSILIWTIEVIGNDDE